MAIVRLQTGSSAVWAFQSMMGKIKASTLPDQPNDVEYRLIGGDRTYLPLPVSDQLRAARIQDGQQFEITRLSVHNFQIRPIGAGSAAETAPPTIAQTTTSAAQSATSRNGYHNPVPAAPPSPPPPPVRQPVPPVTPEPERRMSSAAACMCSAMCAAVDAIIETQAYATRSGIGLTFSEESVRAIGLSIYIDQCRNGGAR
jgi:hypothetical protein